MAPQLPELTAHIQNVLSAQPLPQLSNSVIPALVYSVDQVSKALRSAARVSQIGTANAFGDDQLNVDVLAEKIIRDEIAKCPTVVTASSEEDPIETPTGTQRDPEGEETYTVAFDPLDGSSIIAANWSVGAIFGIWDRPSALHHIPAERQVAAVIGVFGPRTTAYVAIRAPGTAGVCFEVGLSDVGGATTCEIIRPKVELLKPPFKTRYFAPGNLRAAAESKQYGELINRFIQQKYTLRYIGGLVPDIVHALVVGQGVYVNPVFGTSKAKLRRLYELTPVALIVECAGGSALNPATGRRILEDQIQDTDERGGLVCGTPEEVDLVKEALCVKA